MGVPVVTLVGNTVVGRAGLCYASNLRMPSGRKTPKSMWPRARLAAERPHSRAPANASERLRRSPLMDLAFRGNIEQAYGDMWRAWCDSR